ncbi:hypothetical protein [Halosegnis sp.]|uniref:DUF7114 family protein n=1 Tax=Halosegnis sp. TaxID=2864959 RepID=UPI0035D5131C
MDEAAAVQGAAREAVDDIVPASFRDEIERFVVTGSPTPGVLTLLAAEAAGAEPATHTDRAVGVQLIYGGLRLTRRLADNPPWVGEDSAAREQADVDILAADALVARGFYLLADTAAATAAVDVVQSFGRTQTHRQQTEDPPVDRELEADVLELALVAGATAGGATPHDPEAAAAAFAEEAAGLPAPDALREPTARERIAAVAGGARPVNRND